MPDQTTNLNTREKPVASIQAEKGRITRRTGAAIQTNTSMGDIPDTETGLAWLAAKGLLAPLGTTPTLVSLAKTLFQVGALPSTPLQTLNGICVVAFLLQELELMSTAKEIFTLVSKELTPS